MKIREIIANIICGIVGLCIAIYSLEVAKKQGYERGFKKAQKENALMCGECTVNTEGLHEYFTDADMVSYNLAHENILRIEKEAIKEYAR